jgi:hypothetical protein
VETDTFEKPLSMPRLVATIALAWVLAAGWSAYVFYPARSPEAYERARSYAEHELSTRPYIRTVRRAHLRHLAYSGYRRVRIDAYAWTAGTTAAAALITVVGWRRQKRLRREALARASGARTA